MIGKTVCLSIERLYEKYGESLTHCTISTKDEGYFDLRTIEAGIVCMDGEECEVLKDDEFGITLINRDGEADCEFKLTKEEFEIAYLRRTTN